MLADLRFLTTVLVLFHGAAICLMCQFQSLPGQHRMRSLTDGPGILAAASCGIDSRCPACYYCDVATMECVEDPILDKIGLGSLIDLFCQKLEKQEAFKIVRDAPEDPNGLGKIVDALPFKRGDMHEKSRNAYVSN